MGKKYLTDGSPETCWTSQQVLWISFSSFQEQCTDALICIRVTFQGLPQFIHITFSSPVIAKWLHITFQGGFVGKKCTIGAISPQSAQSGASSYDNLAIIYPEDVNKKQSFCLPDCGSITQLNLLFNESSDFFGRITIYDLQVEGEHLENTDNKAEAD